MIICPNCGEENPERFRLCGFCGTELAPSVATQEVRRTVTIVFSDLAGSTALGEALDSEAVREVMSRYFDEMRRVLEHHGGRIEKFIGDAVMAVFGLPRLHEDDALRAVRAAFEMREALTRLNDELDRVWGVRLTNRTGVNTGEVVAGDPSVGQRLVTGDAVNVAARLEQAAPPNETVIGELTYRLVAGAVEVERLEPLALKGKSEPVPGFRLLAVRVPEAAMRAPDTPIVGRERELAALKEELAHAVEDRSCRQVALIGEAGVGKTRLAEVFVADLSAETIVLRGRCLPYGRGITFWPLIEVVKAAAGVDPEDAVDDARSKLRAVAAGDERVTERLASALGLGSGSFPVDEVFWAVRKLFERLAADRPLIVFFEDIHWAELRFLDLIEHLTDSVEGAAVLLVCPTRHDLLERRPDWAQRRNSRRLELERLTVEETTLLIEQQLGRAGVPEEIRARIVSASEGNPLFVEQLLSMMLGEGLLRPSNGGWAADERLSELAIPPSIHALLAARLDRLSAEERTVVEAAAVVGLVFSASAVEHVVQDGLADAVPGALHALEEKRLVRRTGDAAYRFHHILVRDAVYKGLLKRSRATLHERFVEWADRTNRIGDRATEYEEILGYHLEQAYVCLSELGPLGDHGRSLGVRAAARLSAAGKRAFARADMPAAANLLRRSVTLLPEADPGRLPLLPSLSEAMLEIGEFAWAQLYADDAVEQARTAGDDALEARARLMGALVHAQAGESAAAHEPVAAEARRAIPVFERAGDDAGLAAAYRSLARVHGTACRFGDAAAAARQAIEHATRAEDDRQRMHASSQYAIAALHGPTHVAEAIAECERILDQASADRRAYGLVTSLLAPLEAMRGDFERARSHARRAQEILDDLGRSVIASSTSQESAVVEMLAGDFEAAERDLRRDYEALTEMGEKYLLSTIVAELARAVTEQGRLDEALRLTRTAEELTAPDDIGTNALWRSVRARILARTEDTALAADLAAEAVALLRRTDAIGQQGDALLDAAEAFAQAGCVGEARAAVTEALELYMRKGNVVAAGRAEIRLSTLAGASDATVS